MLGVVATLEQEQFDLTQSQVAAYAFAHGCGLRVLLDVGRLVGPAALTSRPADLPQLPRRAQWTAKRPAAAHVGRMAGDRF